MGLANMRIAAPLWLAGATTLAISPSLEQPKIHPHLRRTQPITCDVRLAIYENDDDVPPGTPHEEALHCFTTGGKPGARRAYEIDGLEPGAYGKMMKDIKAAKGGMKRYNFPGASLRPKRGGGNRAGTDAIHVQGLPEEFVPPGQAGNNGNIGNGNAGNGNAGRSLVTGEVTTGTPTLLVLRVSGSDNTHVGSSVDELRTRIFGDVSDNVTLAKQMAACSYQKLNFVKPLDDPAVELLGGVVQLNLTQNITDVASGTVYNYANTAAEDLFGSLDAFDYRMFILPPEVDFGTAAAFAWVPFSDSVYKDFYADYTWVQMHELGHNLGLAHSGEGTNPYGDITGYMGGNGCYSCEAPMCFNAQKSSYLGWYADREATIPAPVANSPWTFVVRLIGISDYGNANVQNLPSNYVVALRVENPEGTDLYMTFNDADGINAGTAEYANRVTVVEGENGGIAMESRLIAEMGAQQQFIYNNFAGSSNPLILSVNSITKTSLESDVDFAEVNVTVGTCQNDEQCILYDSCWSGTCSSGTCTAGYSIPNCCGNGVCETGESCALCPSDCCTNNIALGKYAYQSGTAYNGVPARAVDGNSDGHWYQNSITCTAWGFEPWWMVDLGEERLVSNILIYNRLDCCSERLSNVNVSLLDSNNVTVHSFYHLGQAPTMLSFTLEDPPGLSNIREGMMARYIRVSLVALTNYLSLAEVQVFAAVSSCGDGVCNVTAGETCVTCASDCYSPNCCGNGVCEVGESCGTCHFDCCTDNIALGKYTQQSGTAYGGIPSRAVDGNTDGSWFQGSVTCTAFGYEPWWIIDLGSEHLVSNIFVYNRLDCCSERLYNLGVTVLNSENATAWTFYHWGAAPAVTSFTLEDPPVLSTIREGMMGRYVRIELIGRNDYLSLAEVQVYAAVSSCGDGVCNVTAGETCFTCASDCCANALLETWNGIPGVSVSDLTNHPNYPDSPDEFVLISKLEAPTSRGGEFGSRLRTYVIPPETGNYRFWIASDDNGILLLSNSTDEANAVQIASVPDWTGSRQFNKYPEQQSEEISLEQGKAYYLEALYKDHGGGDNLAIAWHCNLCFWQDGNEEQSIITGTHTEMIATNEPTMSPQPSASPSFVPSHEPTKLPSEGPSLCPSSGPSLLPSSFPSSSHVPTDNPTNLPSEGPSLSPSSGPSMLPSSIPSSSFMPSDNPTKLPSEGPSLFPSSGPSMLPSSIPSSSFMPSDTSTKLPSQEPSLSPSSGPSMLPSSIPSSSFMPSDSPTKLPSQGPSLPPSSGPSMLPSSVPSSSHVPSDDPTKLPSERPSLSPSSGPSTFPSSFPSSSFQLPSSEPTSQPTETVEPSVRPSFDPSHAKKWTVLSVEDFESGLGDWIDGGSDVRWYTGSNVVDGGRAPGGSSALLIKDNSGSESAATLHLGDVSAYNSLRITFSFYVHSFENNEDFFLEYSDNGGSSWTIIKTWRRGANENETLQQIANGNTYEDEVMLVPGTNVSIRFRCDASGNNDKIYIDDVKVQGRS